MPNQRAPAAEREYLDSTSDTVMCDTVKVLLLRICILKGDSHRCVQGRENESECLRGREREKEKDV